MIPVIGFILLSLLVKTAAVWVFGVLAAMLSLLTQKQTAVLFTYSAAVVSTVIYYGIGSVSALAFLKFSSPAALSAHDELFGNYINVNVFGEPVNPAVIALSACMLMFVMLIVVTIALYRKCSAPAEQRTS